MTKSTRVMRANPKRAVAAKAKRATTGKTKRAAIARPKRRATSRTMRAATARAEMLIRRPVADVFIAFVDPLITSNFWFTRGSDRLHMGKTVRWEWEMYGFSLDVEVKAVDENRRILIEWPGAAGPTMVEWTFTSRPDNTTFVSISNTGFKGSDKQILAEAIGSTEGFALVLAGAKAFLEHGITLELVSDRFPDGLPAH